MFPAIGEVTYNNISRYASHFETLNAEQECKIAIQFNSEKDNRKKGALFEMLFGANAKLLAQWANKNRHFRVSFSDAFNVASLAFYDSFLKFNPKNGVKVTSFGAKRILGAIYALNVKLGEVVSLPVDNRKLKPFIYNSEAKKLLRERKFQEAANLVNMATEDAEAFYNHAMISTVYVGEELGEDFMDDLILESKDHNLYGRAHTTTENQIADIDSERLLSEAIHKEMMKLDPRHKKIIEDRFLLEKPKTLATLAKEHGVSAERIRQIQCDALSALRQSISPLGLH